METIICRCGKQFNVYPYRIKRSKELFCSKKCKSLYCKPLLGKKRSYYTITKIRDAQIGIKKSSESIIAMRKNQPNRSGNNNSFYGKKHTMESKKAISQSTLKYLKKCDSPSILPRVGILEKPILDKLENCFSFTILRQHKVDNYFLDGFCPALNLAIEIDEAYHNNLREKDIIRENNIKNKINCSFLRIKIGVDV